MHSCSTTCAAVWEGLSAAAPPIARCRAHAIATAPGVKRTAADEPTSPAKKSRPIEDPATAGASVCRDCELLTGTGGLTQDSATKELLEEFTRTRYFSERLGLMMRYYVPILAASDGDVDVYGLCAWLRDVTVMEFLQKAAPALCPDLVGAGILKLKQRKILQSQGHLAVFAAGTAIGWLQYELHTDGRQSSSLQFQRLMSLREVLQTKLKALRKLQTADSSRYEFTEIESLITNVLEDVYTLHALGIVHGNLTCDTIFLKPLTETEKEGGKATTRTI